MGQSSFYTANESTAFSSGCTRFFQGAWICMGGFARIYPDKRKFGKQKGEIGGRTNHRHGTKKRPRTTDRGRKMANGKRQRSEVGGRRSEKRREPPSCGATDHCIFTKGTGINSITGRIPQESDENLLRPALSGGLFEGSVKGHFECQADFALLVTRRARAAACAQRSGLFSKIAPQRIKGFPILVVKRMGEHDHQQVLG